MPKIKEGTVKVFREKNYRGSEIIILRTYILSEGGWLYNTTLSERDISMMKKKKLSPEKDKDVIKFFTNK